MNGMFQNYPPRLFLVICLENMTHYKSHNLRTMCANFILFQIALTHPTHFPKLSNVFCKRHITVNMNFPLWLL